MTNLASVLVDLGNEEAAEELYLAVLAVEPDQIDAAYNLALLLQDRADHPPSISKAVGLYYQVVTAEPSRWDAWANLAAAASESTDASPPPGAACLSACHRRTRALARGLSRQRASAERD